MSAKNRPSGSRRQKPTKLQTSSLEIGRPCRTIFTKASSTMPLHPLRMVNAMAAANRPGELRQRNNMHLIMCQPIRVVRSGCNGNSVVNYLSRFQLDHAVCHIEVVIIMADDEDEFAFRLQVRQKLTVEEVLEFRILVGSPLIEYINRTIL